MRKRDEDNISNSDVRLINRKRLMNLLFHQGERTKQELVQELDLSLATVNLLVKELTERGFLTSGSAQKSTGGRRPVCVKPVYGARYSIGAEAGRDALRMAILDLGGNIVARTSMNLRQENTLEYWQKVGRCICQFGISHGVEREDLLDIGISLGLTIVDEEIVLRKESLQEFVLDMDLAREGLGMTVHFRNAFKMAALANSWMVNVDKNFIYVYLGFKICAAFVSDQKVIDFNGVNGELGSMLTNDARQDGTPGRMADIYSREVMCKRAGVQNLEAFFKKCETDESVRAYWDEYLEKLSRLLHNLYCIFGWDIVIGGSISPYLQPYLQKLQDRVREYYPFNNLPETFISTSELAEYGPAVGAAMIAIDRFLELGVNEPD